MNEYFDSGWGSGDFAAVIAPTLFEDKGFHRWFARLERLTATPEGESWRWNAGSTFVPRFLRSPRRHWSCTRSGDMAAPIDGGHYLAEHIPGARFVELPGDEHYPFVGDVERVVDWIEGSSPGSDPRRPIDRALATVLFTDIVHSTERAAAPFGAGTTYSNGTTTPSVEELQRFGGQSSAPGTASSRLSMARRAASAAPPLSATFWPNSGWRSVRACIPANASCSTTTSAASRSRRPRQRGGRRARGCSSPARWTCRGRLGDRVRPAGAGPRSRASLVAGRCSRSSPPRGGCWVAAPRQP